MSRPPRSSRPATTSIALAISGSTCCTARKTLASSRFIRLAISRVLIWSSSAAPVRFTFTALAFTGLGFAGLALAGLAFAALAFAIFVPSDSTDFPLARFA